MTTQSKSFSSNNLSALLAFPFKDEDWKNKFLIGSLIVFASFAIPLIPFFFLYGYMMQIMRHIIVDKGEPLLPKWDDWGKLLVDGLKLLGVMFIYMLPVIVLMTIGFFLIFFFPLLGIPLTIIGAEENPEIVGAAFGILGLISMIGYFIIFGLAMIIGLAIGLILPAVLGHVVATDDFGAAFRMKEWWPIFKANLGGFFLAYLIVFLVSIIINSALMLLFCTVVLCCLVPILIAPITLYLVVIAGAVFGFAYRDGVEKLAAQPTASETPVDTLPADTTASTDAASSSDETSSTDDTTPEEDTKPDEADTPSDTDDSPDADTAS